jgi:hypothetical protein
VSELETRLRAFICNCSCCSFGAFRQGSYGRRGDVGAVMGAGISADVTDVTALSRPCVDSANPHPVGTEASREWVVVSPGRARMGESLADTAGPAPKVGSQACPFKTAC